MVPGHWIHNDMELNKGSMWHIWKQP
jgi:hypothetical protein